MVKLTKLTAGTACLELAPEIGGAIARLDVGGKPLLRRWTGDETDPFSLACNVLMPFSNRISGGGFTWNETFYPLGPNFEGEPNPIHGDGFLKSWGITKSGTSAQMTLLNGEIGPWKYRARQDFHLTPDQLKVTLTIQNTGLYSLPFGLGLHPWFPRNSGTRISFSAKSVWLENTSYLPTKELNLSSAPAWSFEHARSLPATWMNNCYTGFCGSVRIDQTAAAVSCTITCDQSLEYAHIFSPGEASDFFCFEPVTHPVDSLNLPRQPGQRELKTGGTLATSVIFSWK